MWGKRSISIMTKIFVLSVSKFSTRCSRSLIVLLNIVALLICTTGQVAAQTKVTYFHNDLSGNPVAASDSTGQIIWRESYRPYGERLKNEAASQTNSQWYTGHRQDADTGLVYMGARHYDPLIGRFLSIDPAGFSESNPHSFNRYAYANNNPMKYTDPDGRDAVGIVYKGYQVDTGFGFKLRLGHGGVLLIDNDNGRTKYYEYGRYDPNGKGIIGEKLPQNEGNIRTVSVPDAVIGDDGKATKDSLQKIYDSLSKSAGKGNAVDATYHETADFQKGKEYVEGLAKNKNRDKYSVYGCNCFDFKDRTIEAAKSKE
jgi:RHS repeat-associated protein